MNSKLSARELSEWFRASNVTDEFFFLLVKCLQTHQHFLRLICLQTICGKEKKPSTKPQSQTNLNSIDRSWKIYLRRHTAQPPWSSANGELIKMREPESRCLLLPGSCCGENLWCSEGYEADKSLVRLALLVKRCWIKIWGGRWCEYLCCIITNVYFFGGIFYLSAVMGLL